MASEQSFSIAVRYLNGWAMATHPSDRGRAEWPPHPDRMFMALVAAADDETRFDEALRWLERQLAPALLASAHEQRTVVTSYVPVNDAEISRTRAPKLSRDRYAGVATLDGAKAAGLNLLPEFRGRQPRTFPVAIPHDPTVHFIFAAAPPAEVREQLAELCARVARVGHSASLVQCWSDDHPPEPNIMPTTGVAQHRLRVLSPGRLQQLRDLFELNSTQGSDLRPVPGVWAGYTARKDEPTTAARKHSVFDPAFLVLRPTEHEHRRPPLVATPRLTAALRGLLMSNMPAGQVPEALSGHGPDGSRLNRPHLAMAPLPYVGHRHADGRVMGMALILPREETDAAAIGLAIGGKLYTRDGLDPETLTLKMGDTGTWSLQASDDFGQASLRPEAWTAAPHGSKMWATVTPIALDRHTKGRLTQAAATEIETSIAEMCFRIGLPGPAVVQMGAVSMHTGAPHASRFPRLPRKDGTLRRQTHALIGFAEPVVGPVLLGAGRYRGYGLCRPLAPGQGGGE